MVLQENPNDAFYPWAPCGISLLFLVIKEGHWIFMMTKKSRAPISCPNVEGNYAWGQRSSLPRSACEVHWPSRPRILGRWPRVICWACTFQNPTDRVHPCFLGSSVQPHINEYICVCGCIYIYIELLYLKGPRYGRKFGRSKFSRWVLCVPWNLHRGFHPCHQSAAGWNRRPRKTCHASANSVVAAPRVQ